MLTLQFLRLALALSLSSAIHAEASVDASAAQASAARAQANRVEGLVKKIDKATGKVTIQHGPLDNLNLPPMTMAYRLKDPAWMDKMQTGDKILFIAERVDGALTVIDIKTTD